MSDEVTLRELFNVELSAIRADVQHEKELRLQSDSLVRRALDLADKNMVKNFDTAANQDRQLDVMTRNMLTRDTFEKYAQAVTEQFAENRRLLDKAAVDLSQKTDEVAKALALSTKEMATALANASGTTAGSGRTWNAVGIIAGLVIGIVTTWLAVHR